MIEGLDPLLKQAKKAADLVKSYAGTIRVFGQYDADWITATSIFVKALLREGKSFHVSVYKQLTKANQLKVSESKESLLVFLDFGSGQLEFLNSLKGKKIIIIDHHQPQGKPEDHIIQVNPIDFGCAENISSSGTSYLLAKTIDNSNKDLAELAIIGAIGDSQAESTGDNWGLNGINKLILKDGIDSNKVSARKGLRVWGRTTRPIHKALEYSNDPFIPGVSGSQMGAVSFLQENGIELKNNEQWRTLSDLSQDEQKKLASAIIIQRVRGNQENPEWIFGDVYDLVDRPDDFRDAAEFATMVNACGKMGKASLGIQFCMGAKSSEEKIKTLLDEYRKKLGSAISWLEQNKEKTRKETDSGIYILAGDKISEHILSNVVSMIHRNNGISKPLFGFSSSEEGFKVSARAKDEEVSAGINLKQIMETASKEVGGEGGGHAAASGASIPAESIDAFIERVDGLLSEAIKNKNINILTEDNQIEGSEIRPHQSNNYAETGPEKAGAERQGKTEAGPAKEPEGNREAAGIKSRSPKKMEGKGLVQYFVS